MRERTPFKQLEVSNSSSMASIILALTDADHSGWWTLIVSHCPMSIQQCAVTCVVYEFNFHFSKCTRESKSAQKGSQFSADTLEVQRSEGVQMVLNCPVWISTWNPSGGRISHFLYKRVLLIFLTNEGS